MSRSVGVPVLLAVLAHAGAAAFVVRAMVLRREVNPVMDALSALGAQAILAYDIRSCRL